MKTSKRILCMLLAVMMTLSMSTAALAASDYATEIWLDTTTLRLYKGNEATLEVSVSPSDYNGAITWSSDNANITVTPTEDPSRAVIRASEAAKANDTATITVAVKKDSSTTLLSTTCKVTVALDGVDEVEITEGGHAIEDNTYVYIPRNGSKTFGVRVTSLSGETITPTVTWKTDNSRIANYSSIGEISYVSDGITTVTATAAGADGKSVSDSIDIVVGAPTNITITGPKSGAETAEMVKAGYLASGSSYTFSVSTEPSAFKDLVTWSCEGVGEIDEETGNFTTSASDEGTATITATIGQTGESESYTVYVSPLQATGIEFDDDNITMGIGNTKELTYDVFPNGATGYTLVWDVVTGDCVELLKDSSGNPNGRIKATKSGTASVSVTIKDSEGKVKGTDYCQITVQNATYNPATVNAKVGTNASLGLASTIASQFKSKTGCTSNPATITIDSITGTNAKLIYTGSSSTASAATAKDYTYSAFGSLYLRPTTAGTYYVAYTATNGSYQMTGTITIKVTANAKNITIELDNSEDDYVFTSDKNSDKTPAYEIIADTIGSSLSYITFGSIDAWNDDDVGSLYVSSGSKKTVEDYNYEYLNKSSGTYTIRKLCFSPNGDEGTFAINYSAYNSSDVLIASGVLSIIVGEGSDGDVVVTLDDNDPYYFSDDTKEDDDSAYGLIYDFIEDETTLDGDDAYIEFVDFIDDDAGTLYYDDNENVKIKKSKRYSMDEVYDFYFVPEEAGTYEVEFEIYSNSSSSAVKASGVLQIIVPGDSNVVVTLDDTKSYAFSKDTKKDDDSAYNMILDYLEDATDKTISYVRFGTVSKGSDVGALYASSTLNASKVTALHKFYVSALSSTSLYDLTFVPAKAGTFEIPFTAYTSSGVSAASGTLSLVVPGGTSINADGDVVVTLDNAKDAYYFEDDTKEDDDSAYNMIVNYVDKKFDIDLEKEGYFQVYAINEDDAGTLYLNDNKNNIKLKKDYYDTDLDDFYFVPKASGIYEIEIDIYDDDDDYVDSFIFQIVVPGSTTTSSKTMTCYSNGYTFKTADFYTISDSDPIMSVKFTQPATGKLYVNYTNGSGTAVTSSTKFYTTTSTYGSYRITALTYIPKAGASGDVSIGYTATTSKGKTVTGTITMSVKSKTASSKFSDVTASSYGSWSADAIDFASSWGLVNGVTSTAPYKFEPDGNMKRCDLLLILYRAAGSPAVTGTITHTDVPTTAYYYKAAVWAVKNGITSGFLTSTTTFAPTTTVTREEFATMLYNYTKYTGVSVSNTGSLTNYTDASTVSSYAKDAMTWAVSKGYITSMSTTSLVLGAKNLTERAQIATMLHRYLTY